jgi:hypothetical protein
MTTCPHCGKPVEVHLKAQPAFVQIPVPDGWRRADGSTLASEARAPLLMQYSGEPSSEASYERITPVGRLEPFDVLTSLFDAGVTFIFFTIGVGGVCWYYEAPVIVAPAVASGFLAGCLRYYGGLALAKSLLQTIESVTKKDLNGDGHIGQPQPANPHTVRVEIREDSREGARYQFATLGVEPAKLQALAVAVLRGDSFSERTAVRYSFTQEEFRTLRDEFLERGWAAWNHPNRKQQGVSLTRGGLFILRAIKDSPLPSPTAQSQRDFGPHGSTQQHAARKNGHAVSDYKFIEGGVE